MNKESAPIIVYGYSLTSPWCTKVMC